GIERAIGSDLDSPGMRFSVDATPAPCTIRKVSALDAVTSKRSAAHLDSGDFQGPAVPVGLVPYLGRTAAVCVSTTYRAIGGRLFIRRFGTREHPPEEPRPSPPEDRRGYAHHTL